MCIRDRYMGTIISRGPAAMKNSRNSNNELQIVSSKRLNDHRLPKTEVILSSSMLKEKAQISPVWDKLELFARTKNSQNQAPAPRLKLVPKANLVIGPISMLTKFLEISQNGFLANIDNKKMIKIFSASSVLLMTQALISKRVRAWCSQTMKLLLYILTVLISSGSLGLLALKLSNRKKNRELKNNQINGSHPPCSISL
eukprot:TRINITY_DN4605_c0_g1_i11.p1 TRINITY_DN4605_c0_g1~~TRINITY_DN4605_c0_g1_i11.p1  ORF type:complete len:199 (-),score=34.96 TRINITY_DN4605_c0_g1_i11:412-1008(-)